MLHKQEDWNIDPQNPLETSNYEDYMYIRNENCLKDHHPASLAYAAVDNKNSELSKRKPKYAFFKKMRTYFLRIKAKLATV